MFSSNKDRTKNEFAKYGHSCEIPEEMDDVQEYYSMDSYWSRLHKRMFLLRTVSDISKNYTHHLRSHGAIMKERKRHLIYHNFIIHPYSYFRVIWEFFICLIIIVQLFMIPLHSGFALEVLEESNNILPACQMKSYVVVLLMNDIALCLDILVNMFTGYYSELEKEVVLEFKQINLHYLKKCLIPDIVSSFPFYVIRLDTVRGVTIINLMLLLKVLRFLTFINYFTRITNFFRVRYWTASVALLLIGVAIYWHSLTCYLIYVKYFDKFMADGFVNYPTFRQVSDRIGQPIEFDVYTELYIYCFYQTSMIIYASWYTKDQPKGILEYAGVTVMWFCSKVIQFFVLARMLQIMKGINSSHQKFIGMERQLKEYMRDKQLPTYMRNRLLSYYDFRFQRNYFRESEILATISGQLRQEIILHSCRQLVENVAFFKNLPINLLVRIVSCLRCEIYLINDVIIRANTPGDCMYFIASGTVAVYSTSGKEICHLEDGSHFGEVALVNKSETRIASVVAIEICEVYRFDEKDFVRAIHPYPDLLESIERIAADRMEKTMMLDEHNRREMAVKRVKQL